MSRPSPDAWYVRLPTSQVVRANSTKSVRHHIKKGTIPPESWARRSPLNDWTPLSRIDAFADLLNEQAESRHGRRQPSHLTNEQIQDSNSVFELQAVGVRGIWLELVNALDSSFAAKKLSLACGVGLTAGVVPALIEVVLPHLETPWYWIGLATLAVAAGLVYSTCTILLSQLTFIELSQLRPAQWKEARQGLFGLLLRLIVCLLIVLGAIGGLLYLVHWLPQGLTEQSEIGWLSSQREIWLSLAVLLQIAADVLLLPMLGMVLLLAPILVVEELSVPGALHQWQRLIRTHPRRVFFTEALTAALAMLTSLPLFVPVLLAAYFTPMAGVPGLTARATLWLLTGLALTPAITYLKTANVYIYLHMRFHQPAYR